MSKVHKWKMTDKPHDIAKKFKFKKFDEIWDAPENKKLKSSRKKPENIKKGDNLVIPPSKKERLLTEARITALKSNITQETKLGNSLNNLAGQFEQLEISQRRLIKDFTNQIDTFGKELDNQLKQVQKWGEGVDFAYNIIMMTKNLTSLAKKTKSALSASGSELKKINADMMKEGAKIATAPAEYIADEAKKSINNYIKVPTPVFIKDYFSLRNDLEKFVDKVQKPSYWAVTGASLLSGEGIVKSFTRDLEKEKNQQKMAFMIPTLQLIAKLWEHVVNNSKAAKIRRVAAKEALSRAKAYKKELSALEKL